MYVKYRIQLIVIAAHQLPHDLRVVSVLEDGVCEPAEAELDVAVGGLHVGGGRGVGRLAPSAHLRYAHST